MRTRSRLLLGVAAWLVFFAGAAWLLAREHAQERESMYERFANRADTGANFVAAYVDDVFETEVRTIPALERNIAHPRRFVELTQRAGFEASVVLDRRGRALAVAPMAPDMIGSDLTDRTHLATALRGERAVSDVVPSLADGKPIVDFALPLDDPDLGVFSAGYDLSASPLQALLGRQPIAGTRGYLIDSSGGTIVFAGEGAVETLEGDPTKEALDTAVETDDRVIAASRVPGTPWVYRLDAPRDAILEPVEGERGEWGFLGGLGLISLIGVLLAARATAVREQAREDKEAGDRRLRLTVEHAPIGMAMLDLAHRFMEPNARLCAMLDHTSDDLVQMTLEGVTHGADLGLDVDLFDELLTGAEAHFDVVKRLVRGSGEVLWARLSVSLVRDNRDRPEHFVVQIEDVTQIRVAEAELKHRALYDSLTELANRGLLLERLEAALADSRGPLSVGVGFCDLDHFKDINDTHGHYAGDAVIRAVARRLTDVVRSEDTIARMGGDEFVVLLTDLTSPDEARRVMERARRAVGGPVEVGDLRLQVGLSMGLAFGGAGDSVDHLLANADVALYAAKRSGRNRLEVYNPEMRSTASGADGHVMPERRAAAAAPSGPPEQDAIKSDQLALETTIREALDQDLVGLAYQPVFDLATGLVVEVEALLRLRDSQGALIPPDLVIPAAERSGLIVDLGWRVLQLATAQCAAWRDEHGVVLPVAVNVSAAQLESPDFSADVAAAVNRAGIPSQALSLELTESMMLSVSPGAAQLHDLRQAGFELAIDDFGTGYASLSYLHELPASALKIDRSFVAGLPDDRRAVAIVAAVVALARNCGIECIAEGIETEDQRVHLTDLGVLGQGFLLGRPDDAGAIGRMIADGRLAPLAQSQPGGPAGMGAGHTPLLDTVTGLYRRGPGLTELDREVARAQRSLNSLVLVFARVEGGHIVHGAQGPRVGDVALAEVAATMKRRLHSYDLVVRYEGDEFICAIAGTPRSEVERRFASISADLAVSPGGLSLLLGMAEMQAGESSVDLVARADAALPRPRDLPTPTDGR